MKKLSSELRAQRQAYRGMRYSGDLVADVMLRRVHAKRRWPWVGLAAAALIAGALYLRPTAPAPTGNGQLAALPQVPSVSQSNAMTAQKTNATAEEQELRFALAPCTFGIAPPTMSFVSTESDDTTTDANATAKKEPA